MKRYVFSLHRVLRVRDTEETVARQALRGAAEHAKQADDEYDFKMRNYEANVASAASLRGSVLNMLAMRDIAARRARELMEAQQAQADAHAALDLAADEWAQTKQRLGALENLDERQRAEYRAAYQAAEQAEADDLVTGRARRGSVPGTGGEAGR